MTATIRVINPNSNPVVTEGIAAALVPMERSGTIAIDSVTLAQGPYGIESQADMDHVTIPLRDLVAADETADAFVIACYSDPGLHVCREATARPVFGIAECGVLTALARGDRFGVLAIANPSIRRHMRYLRQMSLVDRLAGERALDMTVAETASGDATLERMTMVGRKLVANDGADVVIMGCAGMARHRRALESELGVPVIDPTQAAVAMAAGTLLVR